MAETATPEVTPGTIETTEEKRGQTGKEQHAAQGTRGVHRRRGGRGPVGELCAEFVELLAEEKDREQRDDRRLQDQKQAGDAVRFLDCEITFRQRQKLSEIEDAGPIPATFVAVTVNP